MRAWLRYWQSLAVWTTLSWLRLGLSRWRRDSTANHLIPRFSTAWNRTYIYWRYFCRTAGDLGRTQGRPSPDAIIPAVRNKVFFIDQPLGLGFGYSTYLGGTPGRR